MLPGAVAIALTLVRGLVAWACHLVPVYPGAPSAPRAGAVFPHADSTRERHRQEGKWAERFQIGLCFLHRGPECLYRC